MKKNLRDKISAFIASEEGRVSVKAPLTIGVATGSMLLATAIVGTPHADACGGGGIGCPAGQVCDHGTCRPE